MKITHYFIKHSVTSIILNGLIIITGLLCLHTLTLREYPAISFPVITVSATYQNASPDLVESAVTSVLEEQLAGVEGLDTITSQSSSGYGDIMLVFRAGTSLDRALTATQDAVNKAKGALPSEMKPPVIERQLKANGLPFIGISLESNSRTFGQLTHFAYLRLKNAFRSLPGVASVDVWGQPYTYEITLDSKKLFSLGVNANEVLNAIAASNVALPAGNFQNTTPTTLDFELKTKKDYENLVIKTLNQHPILLKSISDVKLTTDISKMRTRVNGHTGLVVSINSTNDANPLEVSQAVRKELAALQQTLPPDIKANLIIDQSDYINASIKSIRSAIAEAIFLVLAIVFLFLRNARATIIPLITIPISLLGSLIFLKLFGFSINLMTLLAMVLAIGLVVDDAIIVVENIWRHIEDGLSPLAATFKGSKEIGFAIVAMTGTLASVYMPIAFIEGMLGQLFIEFATALAGSVIISGLVALTLSPIMCATLLKNNKQHHWPQLDRMLDKLTTSYSQSLSWFLQRKHLALITALTTLGFCLLFYNILPHETAPKEDRGLIIVRTPAIAGKSLDEFDNDISIIEKTTRHVAEAENQLSFVGDWGASILLPLKPHNERKRSATQIVSALNPLLRHYPSIDPLAWSWDTGLPGAEKVGHSNEIALVISTQGTYKQLFDQVENLKVLLDKSKKFQAAQFDLRLNTNGYSIDIDNNALAKLGLSPAQVAKTIEIFFSGDQSLKFHKDSVLYNLTIKGTPIPWTLDELYLTTPGGKRVSLGAIASMKMKAQPATLDHFKQMRSTTLKIELLPHDSPAHGMKILQQLAKNNLPSDYKLSWTGVAKTYQESSYTMLFLMLLSLVFIYAILSVQFENFLDPFIILFAVPLACSGALLLAWLAGQSINIYSQVGLITLIGLISKHGILIVEFANQLRAQGISSSEAIQKACALRLRPILMTTGAMIFGAIPLILSHAAGAEARHAIGSVLLGGLGIGTFFTLFVLPGIYALRK